MKHQEKQHKKTNKVYYEKDLCQGSYMVLLQSIFESSYVCA